MPTTDAVAHFFVQSVYHESMCMDQTCKTHTNQKTLKWSTVNPLVPEAGAPVVSSGILLHFSPLKSDSVFFFFFFYKAEGVLFTRALSLTFCSRCTGAGGASFCGGSRGQEGGLCRGGCALPSQQHEHEGDFVQLGALAVHGGIVPRTQCGAGV